jgi:hypothetical protein
MYRIAEAPHRSWIARVLPCSAVLLVVACTSKSTAAQNERATEASAAASAVTAQSQPIQLDACSLVSRADVEAATSRSVREPERDNAANLYTCKYGDAERPLLDGKSLDPVVLVSVFVGDTPAAAKWVQDFARSNAVSVVQPVTGVGSDAFWNDVDRGLQTIKGRYKVDVDIAADAGGLAAAKVLAMKALAKLP